MKRSNSVEVIKVPPEFKHLLDKKRVEKGYNNRQRQQFLRDLCAEEDPIGSLFDKPRQPPSAKRGIDFGF